MWADNEASIDLLQFGPIAELVQDLLCSEPLLPLTVGIFGDWGSGKTTLMKMCANLLRTNNNVVVVEFQPWLHKDYDDVRSALMVAIVDALESRRSLSSKAAKAISAHGGKLLRSFAKRIDWLRAISFLTKTGVGVGMALSGHPAGVFSIIGGLQDAGVMGGDESADKGLLKKEEFSVEINQPGEPLERGISEFRSEFASLIDEFGLDSLVVIVDDLDRCLPDTIVDVLEAIRLFFAVPKTSFLIGADERIIRHALSTRYPEAPEYAADLGRDYLEKIIQVPVHLPPLAPPDIETYILLLVISLHVQHTDARFSDLLKKIPQLRAAGAPLTVGIANEILGTQDTKLAEDLTVMAGVAPVLAALLAGKPREVKRFLNELYLRRRLAELRGLTIRFDILAKISVAEYFLVRLYRRLFTLQRESPDGKIAEIEDAEKVARLGQPLVGAFEEYALDNRVLRWLSSEPSLGNVDLRSYFTLAPKNIADLLTASRQLPEHLQSLVAKLQSPSELVRNAAKKASGQLATDDAARLAEAISATVRTKPTAESIEALLLLTEVNVMAPGMLSQTLSAVDPRSVPFTVPGRLRNLFAGKGNVSECLDILQKWIEQSANPKLRAAALTASKSLREKP